MGKNLEFSSLLDFYGDMLTEKQREVIKYYYNEDLSLSEIAYNHGISRQGVRDAIKRAEEQLLDMEKKLGLVKKFREMLKGLEEICLEARKIKECNKKFIFSKDIYNCAQEIEKVALELLE
ncbi:MAG: DNA-binding protein [Oscillospiraceae bacterium]|nr:DNA-binding protein [Oscillospiraceae bacterium]